MGPRRLCWKLLLLPPLALPVSDPHLQGRALRTERFQGLHYPPFNCSEATPREALAWFLSLFCGLLALGLSSQPKLGMGPARVPVCLEDQAWGHAVRLDSSGACREPLSSAPFARRWVGKGFPGKRLWG